MRIMAREAPTNCEIPGDADQSWSEVGSVKCGGVGRGLKVFTSNSLLWERAGLLSTTVFGLE